MEGIGRRNRKYLQRSESGTTRTRVSSKRKESAQGICREQMMRKQPPTSTAFGSTRRDPKGNLVDGARFKLLSEDSYEVSREIQNGSVPVTIPGECHGRKCLFWFNMDGYRGVNPVQVQLGDSFTETLKPKERNLGAPEVTIEVSYERTEAT